MSWPQAFFGGCMVLALAILVAFSSPAESQQRGAGFMLASGGGAFVWRINTMTGSVSYCARRSDATDPGALAAEMPFCSGASPAAPQ